MTGEEIEVEWRSVILIDQKELIEKLFQCQCSLDEGPEETCPHDGREPIVARWNKYDPNRNFDRYEQYERRTVTHGPNYTYRLSTKDVHVYTWTEESGDRPLVICPSSCICKIDTLGHWRSIPGVSVAHYIDTGCPLHGHDVPDDHKRFRAWMGKWFTETVTKFRREHPRIKAIARML